MLAMHSMRTMGVLGLGLALLAAACSFAGAQPSGEALPGLVRNERTFHSPGGVTRIEQWTTASDPVPQVVRAQRYVSGMSLAPGIALVFHATQRQWMLSLSGQLVPLASLQQGQGAAPLLPQGTPNLGNFTFAHDGRQWQLMILSRQVPKPLPGIATEQEQSLDFLLWHLPLR